MHSHLVWGCLPHGSRIVCTQEASSRHGLLRHAVQLLLAENMYDLHTNHVPTYCSYTWVPLFMEGWPCILQLYQMDLCKLSPNSWETTVQPPTQRAAGPSLFVQSMGAAECTPGWVILLTSPWPCILQLYQMDLCKLSNNSWETTVRPPTQRAAGPSLFVQSMGAAECTPGWVILLTSPWPCILQLYQMDLCKLSTNSWETTVQPPTQRAAGLSLFVQSMGAAECTPGWVNPLTSPWPSSALPNRLLSPNSWEATVRPPTLN